MPLILDGTLGISGVNGSAGTPSYQGTDNNTGIFYPTADTIAFAEGGVEVMRIDSSGRVGIGTASPTYTLEVAAGTSGQQALANFRTANSTATSNAGLQIYATPSATAASRSVMAIWDADGADSSSGDYFYINKLGNSGNVEIAQYSDASMIFSTNVGAERMRITSTGRLLINTPTARTTLDGDRSALVQIEGTSVDQGMSIFRNENGAFGPTFWLGKSRGTTTGSNTAVQSGDGLGSIAWLGTDGTKPLIAALITTQVDGTPGTNDMPGRLVFFTTADGASSVTERMRIDSSGNVGIGTSTITSSAGWSPRLVLAGTDTALVVKGSSGQENTFGTSGGLYIDSLGHSTGTSNNIVFRNTSTNSSYTANERMRIHSNGYITMGTTNTNIDAGPGFKFIATTNAYVGMVVESSINSQTNYHLYSTGAGTYRFYVGAGGTIYATATTIVAISDVRLKENIQDIDVGLDAIMALKPRKFDWKEGKGKDKKGDRGWIAQEFEQVFPDMIENWKDPAPEGEEPYKAVSADLIPVLVKAIQEQQAMIEELKARIETLEAK